MGSREHVAQAMWTPPADEDAVSSVLSPINLELLVGCRRGKGRNLLLTHEVKTKNQTPLHLQKP